MTDENIHIGQLMKQFVGYWKIYVPIGVLCLFAGIIFILVTPKEYEITARIQLITEQQGMAAELKMLKSSAMGAFLGGGGSSTNTDDEALLMTSRTNLLDVIQQTEYQLETKTRKGLKKLVIDKDESPVSYLFPPSFLDTISAPISITLSVDENSIKKVRVESTLFDDLTFENKPFPFDMLLPTGTITIMRRANGIGKFTTQITPLQRVYEQLREMVIVVSPATTSDILLLECKAENKQRACGLLNTMMNTYNDYSRKTKKQETETSALFIRDQLDTITVELALIEHRLEVYKQSNNMPDPSLYGSITYMGNKETEKLILETKTRLRMIDYVVDYMNKPANINAVIPMMDGIADGAIAAYNQLLFTRQRLAQSSEIDNPALKLVDNQLKEQRKILVESVDNIRKNIHISLDALTKKDAELSRQVSKLPMQEREYIEMLRQQKLKESIYLFLMQKLQEKELTNSPDELAGRIVDKAYSTYKPVFPKSSVVLAIAFLLACILSLIVISLKIRNK